MRCRERNSKGLEGEAGVWAVGRPSQLLARYHCKDFGFAPVPHERCMELALNLTGAAGGATPMGPLGSPVVNESVPDVLEQLLQGPSCVVEDHIISLQPKGPEDSGAHLGPNFIYRIESAWHAYREDAMPQSEWPPQLGHILPCDERI